MHINIVADMRRLINEILNVSNVKKWDITHEIAAVDEKTAANPVKVIQNPTTVKGGPKQPRNSRVTIVANRTTMPRIVDQDDLTTKIKKK